jgi:indolepyruvate ferredoxin oxidoreductase alpha subunit
MKEAVEHDGLSVVISRHPCPLLKSKEGKLTPVRYEINQEKCIRCYTCVSRFSCPALSKEGGPVSIDLSLCIGCGGCAQVCPKQAIEVVR